MKKMILLFLFACLTICLQTEAFAQMQSVLNPSTERSISGFPTFTPKKSLAISNNEIITLCQDISDTNMYYNVFGKTIDGDTNIKVALTFTNLITDFDYYAGGQTIFFCGKDTINHRGFIGYEDINSLFSNVTTSYRYNLPNVQSLQKIYFYYIDGICKKLALIGDGNKFIDFDLSTLTYDVYESPYDLLDIAITDDYVTVLGKVSDTEFILYAHKKTNIPNFTDMSFTTPQAMNYDNNEVYYLTSLDPQSNQDMVSFSNDKNHLNEHCVIDLPSLSVTDDQVTITDIGKPMITDLEYVSGSGTVLCLTYNTTFGNYIYEVRPYGGTYTTIGVIPNTNNNISHKWLYNLASYDNVYYLAVGKTSSAGKIYFFDKEIGNFNQSNCYNTETCDLDTVSNVQPNTSYGYSNIYSDTPQPTTITFINTVIYYTIDCQ